MNIIISAFPRKISSTLAHFFGPMPVILLYMYDDLQTKSRGVNVSPCLGLLAQVKTAYPTSHSINVAARRIDRSYRY
jgi:hypothetical protein